MRWSRSRVHGQYNLLLGPDIIKSLFYSRLSVSLIMNDCITCTVNFGATATGSL